MVGPDIEILRIFYSSKNNEIINYLKNNKLDIIYKNNFINIINSKLERKLNDEYDYSFYEMFSNDNDETFDGNDDTIPKKVTSMEKLIELYFINCEEEKNRNI